MSIFNKITNALPKAEPQLTKRLFKDAWQPLGHAVKEPDTRTTEQLLENIDYYALQCPEVALFKKELKEMNPKYLGLVSDICELANRRELLNDTINFKELSSNGKSLFQFLMEKLPKAAKENPESLELSKSIIDNTDSITAKYAIASLTPLYDCKEAAKHIKATIPMVDAIAEATINGGYSMDYSKAKHFTDTIKTLVSPMVVLEKLLMFPKILKMAEKSKAKLCQVELFPFVTNNTPIEKITENIKTFKKIDNNLEGKTINLTDFLDKNVNIV